MRLDGVLNVFPFALPLYKRTPFERQFNTVLVYLEIFFLLKDITLVIQLVYFSSGVVVLRRVPRSRYHYFWFVFILRRKPSTNHKYKIV